MIDLVLNPRISGKAEGVVFLYRSRQPELSHPRHARGYRHWRGYHA